jgi:hypothetical protein
MSTEDYELSVKRFRERKCSLSRPIRSNIKCKDLIKEFRPYLVIPIYRNHFGEGSRFFRTYIENVVDLDCVDIQIVLSDDQEVGDFLGLLERDNIQFEKANIHF